MNRPELLAPAGSMEAVRASVQSGASAVYMGFGTFHARRGAKNFTSDEMAEAIAYCRARGVKTNITLNILVGDRERQDALRDARFLYEAGADALIIQDVGLARLLRKCAPSLPLHASTQLTISTLDGARMAKELGFSRVVLARETPMKEIRRITAESGVETEIFVHGALCRCYSGQCYLSSVIGRRSGNRGLCAQPCRLPYRYGGNGRESHPLSLKDLSLAWHIPEICEAGISSLKIEGRMKRPEYTAVVTGVYAALLQERRAPTPAEEDALRRVFSREGFTDGYFTGKVDHTMLGIKTDLPLPEVKALYEEAARRFAEGREAPLVPVDLTFSAAAGEPLTLSITDGRCSVSAFGALPETAQKHPTRPEQAEKALRKTGGTPFAARQVRLRLENGLAVPASALNALRREALAKLLDLREKPPAREAWQDVPPGPFETVSFRADETGLLLNLRDGFHDGATVFDLVPPDESSPAAVRQWLARLDVPPGNLHASVSPGPAPSAERLDALLQQALDRYRALLKQRSYKGIIIEARSPEQISPALLDAHPAAVYLPLPALAADVGFTKKLARRVPLAAVLPRVFFDAERPEITRMLKTVRQAGVPSALAGNIGQIPLLREQQMTVYGDFGLNAFSSDTLFALRRAGVQRQTLSFELRLEQVRSLLAPLETELLAYGYLPLMIFELCAIRRKTGRCTCKTETTRLTDRTGHAFPLLPEFGCRNSLLNSLPLALPPSEWSGIDFARLRFTIEPPAECARIARAFASGALPEIEGGATRGLYRRGVE